MRTLVHWYVFARIFSALEFRKTLRFVHDFARIGEQHCITIESNPNLFIRQINGICWWGIENCCCASALVNNRLSVAEICGQEEINIKCFKVVGNGLSACECRSRDVKATLSYGPQNAHSRFWTIA